ncbi:MAG: 23S rRNA (guanosine(2251)-2'-O)-methyltransferase RlmB [Clostridia bacterium]|nr:23S rRNA (guanosine(2251)-2'-O)-methyltransferase RlmB [Clostridia bacterium]
MKTEGRNAVLELLKTGKNIDKILLEKSDKSAPQGSLGLVFAQARAKGVRVQFVDRRVLEKESVTGKHQGVIAFTTDYEYFDLDEIIACKKSEKGGFVILCDGIEDVHNLGSILRVAECAGADGVVISKTGCASVTESVIRISAGAAEHVKVARVSSLNQAVEHLQKQGFWVYALEAGGEDIYAQDFSGNVALVVGGEDSGVKRLTKERCDKVLSIPLQGKVNSLNASVALGIAAYEVVKGRLLTK